jgi:hypothetical protein
MRQQDWTGAIQFRFGKAFAKPSLGVLSLTIEVVLQYGRSFQQPAVQESDFRCPSADTACLYG